MTDVSAATPVPVAAKRSADKVPISFDLHDYLANVWAPGASYDTGERIRQPRKLSTGLEYEITIGGVTGNRRPIFPTTVGATVQSGSVTFTARAMTTASLRATVTGTDFPAVDGLTLSDESADDLIYTVYVAGGVSGYEYVVPFVATLSNPPPETKEFAALVPVQD